MENRSMVLERLLNSLSGPFKVLLNAELKMVNLQNAVERATELKNCLGNSTYVNALIMSANSVNETNSIQLKFFESSPLFCIIMKTPVISFCSKIFAVSNIENFDFKYSGSKSENCFFLGLLVYIQIRKYILDNF